MAEQPKGGSDSAGNGDDKGDDKEKGKRSRVRIVLAGAIALAILWTYSTGSTGGSAVADSASSRGGTQRATLKISAADLQAIETRFARRGLHGDGRLQHDGATCADHAYGAVRDFFRGQPCTDLYRAQLELTNRRGDVVLIAISWVQMPDAASARAYRRLVDAGNAGNVTELSRDGGPYQSVGYTGRHHDADRRGTTVSTTQVEPVGPGWTGVPLRSIAISAV